MFNTGEKSSQYGKVTFQHVLSTRFTRHLFIRDIASFGLIYSGVQSTHALRRPRYYGHRAITDSSKIPGESYRLEFVIEGV